MEEFLVTGFAEASGNASGGQRIVDLPHSISNDGTSGNYLSATAPASLAFTNSDTIIFGCWINMVSKLNNGFIGKLRDSEFSYYIGTDGAGSFDFVYYNGGSGYKEVFGATPLSNSTKYFCLAWVDPATTTINIQVNGGTVESEVFAATSFTMSGGDFFLGDDGTQNLILNGKLDEVFVCKNPANLAAALALLNSTIYNAGTGVRYEGVATADKTTIGLQNWWGVDEASGTRMDLHGVVNLTETGTLTVNTALVS